MASPTPDDHTALVALSGDLCGDDYGRNSAHSRPDCLDGRDRRGHHRALPARAPVGMADPIVGLVLAASSSPAREKNGTRAAIARLHSPIGHHSWFDALISTDFLRASIIPQTVRAQRRDFSDAKSCQRTNRTRAHRRRWAHPRCFVISATHHAAMFPRQAQTS